MKMKLFSKVSQSMIFYIISTVCFFYADQSIFSFDTLKIVPGKSNISQNLRIPRTFDKNTPTIFKNIFLRYFSLFSQRGFFTILV